MTDEILNNKEELSHLEIQYKLAKLGSDLGYQIWIARNDKNKSYNGKYLKDIPNFLNELPRLTTSEKANKIIEMIDVLWLHNKQIMYSWEVEHTTSVYSGLLRQSDLICIHKNLKINPYIIYPDKRKDYVISEINRETFVNNGLSESCKIISYSNLLNEIEKSEPYIHMIKADKLLEMISEKPSINQRDINLIDNEKDKIKETIKIPETVEVKSIIIPIIAPETKIDEVLTKINKKTNISLKLGKAKKPIFGFVYKEKEYSTHILKDALKIICDDLATSHKDFSEKVKSKRYFSEFETTLSSDPYKVKGTNIYVKTNLCAMDVEKQTREILSLFGYSQDIFKFKYVSLYED